MVIKKDKKVIGQTEKKYRQARMCLFFWGGGQGRVKYIL